MSTTLTVRTDESLRKALLKLSQASGKTVSDLVREISGKPAERPLRGDIGHLRGKLRLPAPDAGSWRERLRSGNWRP